MSFFEKLYKNWRRSHTKTLEEIDVKDVSEEIVSPFRVVRMFVTI